VSRALRGDPSILPATRQRIQDAAEQLGYVPSRRGRSLSTRRTGHIALVVSDLGNPFYMEATEHLSTSPPPRAVFCANDVIALGALNAAVASRVAIPGDVSLVGFDDIAIAGWDIVALTTVRQDLPRMAEIAAELLLERVARSRSDPKQVVIPTRLIRRRSLNEATGRRP
jgi:DNA-binding LacI/PurR family transcriptional regulator